jgi:succinyl-diaminopimelate desuccinylase
MHKPAVKPQLMSFFVIDPVHLSQALIKCESVAPEDGGALDVVEETLSQAGFKIERLKFFDGGSYAVDNIFARFGTDAPHICFMGHTDVVPPGPLENWTHPPFDAVIKDGILYGRGAADMKTGVAASIAAAINFIRQNKFKGSISFLITGDEEAESINGTIKVVEWMKQNNQLPDVALVCEPSNPEKMGQMMRVGRRGSLSATLTTRGIQGHSAYPDRFDNPIDKMVKLLSALINLHLDDGTELMPKSHIAVTSVDVGNKASNVVPAAATAKFNVRFNSIWNRETLEQKIREVLDRCEIPYEFTTRCNSLSFITDAPDWIKCVADSVEKISGTRPVLDTGGGTSDARFIAPYCPVVEYGVITATNHQIDEHMKVSDIETLEKTYREILARYFKT